MIESAFDDELAGEAEPAPETETEEPTEEEAEEEEETEEEEEVDEDGDEEEVEEEPEPAAYSTEDVEIQAFLSKYEGDPEKALRAAVELQRVLGRQGTENGELKQQVEQLSGEVRRLQMFGGAGNELLTEEQRGWVEEALGSGNPALYVQRAVDENEFELARAVCRAYAHDDPYTAVRLGAEIDAIEEQITSYVPPLDQGRLLQAMEEQFPDMPAYSSQMANLFGVLGDNHPSVQDARSNDPATAARGLFHIYELARASTASVRSKRDELDATKRQNGADARQAAQVSSSSTSPSTSGTPRPQQYLMPGLTYEDFEQALEAAQ